MGKVYITHDNGQRSFKVSINKGIDVYKSTISDEETFDIHILHLDEKSYESYFIGDQNPDTTDSAHLGKKFFKGNSVLVHIKGRTYLYIGERIYYFNVPKNEVIQFYFSDIGNNDVPYPVALSGKYAYFMLDQTRVHTSKFRPDIVWSQAYSDYYGHVKSPSYPEFHKIKRLSKKYKAVEDYFKPAKMTHVKLIADRY